MALLGQNCSGGQQSLLTSIVQQTGGYDLAELSGGERQ